MPDFDLQNRIRATLADVADALDEISGDSDATADARLRAGHLATELRTVASTTSDDDSSMNAEAIAGFARRIEHLKSTLPKSRKGGPEYKSGAFQCKSDCDLCLENANSPLDQALCYALFARCILKG